MFTSAPAAELPARVVVTAMENPLPPRLTGVAGEIDRVSSPFTLYDNNGAVVPSVTLAAGRLKICRKHTAEAAVVLAMSICENRQFVAVSTSNTVPATDAEYDFVAMRFLVGARSCPAPG
jgi:hypothetical protein